MRRWRLVPLLAVLAVSCATTDRVETLERRLAAAERAQRDLRDALAWDTGLSVDQALARKTLDQAVHDIPRDGSWAIGPADAAVTVVEFADLECPYSAQAARAFYDLFQRHGSEIRIVFKHFPLDFHPRARAAHAALLAAGNQGRFWDYRFNVYRDFADLSDGNLVKVARYLGLDLARFEADRTYDPADAARMDRDIALGRSIGVTGTPTYYVNGLKTNNPTAAVEALLAGKTVAPLAGAADPGCTTR